MVDINALKSGNRKALAKALTLVESVRPDHRLQAEKLLGKVVDDSVKSIRIGLTGVPGVGKSTMIEVLGSHIINQGHKLAVLAVDPSSMINGGAILGDKTRMQSLSASPDAFIRPSPAGESSGGVARRTRESIILCEAAGYDVIIIETVGVGQSEAMVSRMTDLFILMLLPGSGDELQSIKRGVMELADIVIINKEDGNMAVHANLAASDSQQALRLLKPRHKGWTVPVLQTSALDKTGIMELWNLIVSFRETLIQNGVFKVNRQHQFGDWIWMESREILINQLTSDTNVQQLFEALQIQVASGKLVPTEAAQKLVSEFLKNTNISNSTGSIT